jgi:hypothetical protein
MTDLRKAAQQALEALADVAHRPHQAIQPPRRPGAAGRAKGGWQIAPSLAGRARPLPLPPVQRPRRQLTAASRLTRTSGEAGRAKGRVA